MKLKKSFLRDIKAIGKIIVLIAFFFTIKADIVKKIKMVGRVAIAVILMSRFQVIGIL